VKARTRGLENVDPTKSKRLPLSIADCLFTAAIPSGLWRSRISLGFDCHVTAHYPPSGGDRKAQAKVIRYAHGIHESAYRESVLIRSAAEAKLREADRLEREAWNAIMWAGGPAMPWPGDPQAEPSIGEAINGGFDLLAAKCNRCVRVSLVPLLALKQPPETPVWKLEAALYCEPCSAGRR
jgi:hypothetical protein